MRVPYQEIIQFIFFPVVNEGCRVIDEGIVDKPSDLDVATVMSMGFPAYRYAMRHQQALHADAGKRCICHGGPRTCTALFAYVVGRDNVAAKAFEPDWLHCMLLCYVCIGGQM